MNLRPYQQEASDAAYDFIMQCLDPCLIEAATGAGKSLIIADLAKRINAVSGKKILCLAPSRELVEQNREKYLATGNPASIFSASIRKELKHPVVFGTPQTVVNNLHRFNNYAAIIIDEAHGITPTLKTIIRGIQEKNDKVRVIGLSATPYRTRDGYIFANHYEHGKMAPEVAHDPFFHTLAYSIGARDLIDMGYLTPPVIGSAQEHYDTSGLKLKSTGKWDQSTVDAAFVGRGRLTSQIISDVVAQSAGRQGVMVFASTIQHAEEIMESLPPELSEIITGKTDKVERENIITRFKAKQFKYLVNVTILTTGFDASHVDVVAILRATESAGLLQQIIGRGLRLDDEKDDCLILDYAENIERHFPHGDIFDPVIKVRVGAEGEGMEVKCPICHHKNDFAGRPNPDGFPVSNDGYWVDLAGNKVLNSSGVEVPAHMGRRCLGEALVGGRHVRCSYKWSFKSCPTCEAENDIAARYCCECKAEIVDPNQKLLELATRIENDPYRTRTSVVKGMQLVRHIGRGDKPDGVKVVYELEDFKKPLPQWFAPLSDKQFAQKKWREFSRMAFGDVVDMDDALALDAEFKTPEYLVYRKAKGTQFFEIVRPIWEASL